MRQIKEKGYALRFQGKLGDDEIYTGDILAIGIGYWKDSKEHECKIENFQFSATESGVKDSYICR